MRTSNLKECIPSNICLGCVRYIDYDTDSIPDDNLMAPYMYKRKPYAADKEIRLIIMAPKLDDKKVLQVNESNISLGNAIRVPLNFIQKVYVAPTSPEWFRELVEKITRKYEQPWPIHRSSLDAEAGF